MEAAIQVFARKGFYHSRVKDIASKAKVADGTIYLYFKNKDDILISIFEEQMDRIINNLLDILSKEDDPLKKIERFILYHLDLVQKNKELAEVIQVELRQSNKFMKDYIPLKFLKYLNIISGIIKEGQQRGVFKPNINPDLIKRAIFGALDEISLHWVLSKKRKKYNLKKSAREISRVFVSGLTV